MELSESQKKKIEQARIESGQREKERTVLHDVKKNKAKKIVTIVSVLVIIVAALIGYSVYANSASPGPYDNFAKCLTEKGAVMYGAIEWCEYTQEQAAMFGKSFKYVNYVDHTKGPNIKITPTWIINGERYERVQGFDKLAALTGCDYK